MRSLATTDPRDIAAIAKIQGEIKAHNELLSPAKLSNELALVARGRKS